MSIVTIIAAGRLSNCRLTPSLLATRRAAALISTIGSAFQEMRLSGWIGTSYLLSVCCVRGQLLDRPFLIH